MHHAGQLGEHCGPASDEPVCYDPTKPLLPKGNTIGELESQGPIRTSATPLPKMKLASLCTVRLVDPIAFTQIFPYINEQIASIPGLIDDPSQTGFYSGIVESTFAIAQLFSIYQWARLSDIVGRRPCILLGILGVAITSLFLGFSRSLFTIMVSRFIAGLSAGNVAVIHSVLAEITDSTNQAIAYPIYGLCWPIGAIIGPLIGGTFADPATKYPQWFNYQALREYPYLLPGVIAGAIALTGAIFGFFMLEETLPSKRQAISGATPSPKQHIDAAPTFSIRTLLLIPIIRVLCISGAALAFISTAFDVVFVLFCYSPITSGGLAFSSSEIGFCLALSGSIAIAIQVFVLPYLLSHMESVNMYMWCMRVWPAAFMAMPLLNVLARQGMMEDGSMDRTTRSMVWVGIAVLLLLSRIACIAYSLAMILTRDHAPSPAALGATNGLAQLSMSFARAFSPAIVSSGFALSVDYNVLGGHLWAGAMIVISVFSARLTDKIPEALKEVKTEGRF